jgi:hypothetical protein
MFEPVASCSSPRVGRRTSVRIPACLPVLAGRQFLRGGKLPVWSSDAVPTLSTPSLDQGRVPRRNRRACLFLARWHCERHTTVYSAGEPTGHDATASWCPSIRRSRAEGTFPCSADAVSNDRNLSKAIAAVLPDPSQLSCVSELNDGPLHHTLLPGLATGSESAVHHPFRC